MTTTTQPITKKQGAEDGGRFFRYMVEFVGFTPAHAETIRETSSIN